MSRPNVGDTWYRFVDVQYAPQVNEYDEPCGEGTLKIRIDRYLVEKVTPKGVRLDSGRFVLDGATKRYACATQSEALTSFIARKQRQLGIYQARAARAKKAIRLANGECECDFL